MTTPTLILAPMRGLTTMHYRKAFVRHFDGLDVEMAPFIPTVSADKIHPKLLKDVLPENNSGLPLIPQVIGNRADDFLQMTRALHDLGYQEANWNMGCPHKPIRNKKRGSGLLPETELVDSILDQVCGNSPCRISVKVRLGVSDKTELESLIPVLNRYPLSEVIVHPRTAEQMYDGTADLDAFEKAYNMINAPVCYNGDINDTIYFQKLKSRFPTLDRFMLGRGLLANPFLGELIKQENHNIPNAIERITAFHNDVVASYEAVLHGDRPVLGKMKEFWVYQSAHLSNGHLLFKKLKKAQHLSTYRTLLAEYLPEAEWIAP